MSGLGCDFKDAPLEEQSERLRIHATAHDLLIGVLLTAVERLGLALVWGDEDGAEGEGQA